MRTFFCLLFLSVVTAFSGSERIPTGEILELHLGMTEEQAHERLQKIGTLARTEEGWQEVWHLRDPAFTDVIVGVGDDGKLHFITLVAREGKEAKRKKYGELGDLKTARQMGDPRIKNFSFQWELPPRDGRPRTLVTAAGRDSKFPSTYSLKNLENHSGKKEKD